MSGHELSKMYGGSNRSIIPACIPMLSCGKNKFKANELPSSPGLRERKESSDVDDGFEAGYRVAGPCWVFIVGLINAGFSDGLGA